VLANTIFEGAVEKILDVTTRFASALEGAGIPYRVVGGFAVFLHIDPVDPMAARLTKDVDVAIDRHDLDAIRVALTPHGFTHRHVAGVDMFLDAKHPGARSAVHAVFIGEKVRPEYLEPVPGSAPVRDRKGILIAPVADLVRMKLTSFRLKDKVHIQDLDGVGLITPEIEQSLSEPLRQRLAEVRATE
jgi:hypothetical protein